VTHDVPDCEIETTDSTVVYQNRWMLVREDKVVRRSGAEGVYGVVEKSDFAVVAALQDAKLYLVEQFRYPVGARFWEFPQGASHQSDVSPLELAAAELREETGLVAASIQRVGRLFPSYGYCTQAFDVFVATGLVQHSALLEPEEEGLVARAFSVSDVERMIVEGTIRDAPTVAAFGLLRLKGVL
jgi:ADP-ribose pyrophosphatase